MTTHPFDKLNISDTSVLINTRRSVCPGCNRSSKNFCPKCNLPLDHSPPSIHLPIPVDIYRHPGECHGKTTSTHAKLVAPTRVKIYIADLEGASSDTELMSRYPDPSRVLLLFPSTSAVPLTQIKSSSFDRLIVLDGTWKQAKAMTKRLSQVGFRHVKIESHETLFWRYQQFDRTFLATIEAIYWFYREYFDAYLAHGCNENIVKQYSGEYDNMLFYFKHNWELIQLFYKSNPKKSFTHRHIDGAAYIQYDDKNTELTL